jgi:hypothetical protein
VADDQNLVLVAAFGYFAVDDVETLPKTTHFALCFFCTFHYHIRPTICAYQK